MSLDEILKRIVAIIKSYLPPDYKILFFGSWIKGNALDTSDIDIGILGDGAVKRDVMTQILDKVDEIPTLRSVDIVDLSSKEENYRENILKYAKILN